MTGNMRQHSTNTGAKGIVSGTVSNGATWIESFELSQNDLQISGADTSTWKFVFKRCDGGSADLTLTSGTEITVTQNVTSTIFAISAGPFPTIIGDYQADFAQKTVAGVITHWLSGTITFINENLGF